MTAPGADSTNGIACAVVLPDRGAMNATTVSSHDAYTAAPGRPAGAQQPAEREPGLGRVHRPRVGAGQGPAQARRGPGDRQPGQRPHPRIAGQRRDRIPGSWPQPHDHPGTTVARTATHPARTTAVTVTATVGVCGHACPVRPCRRSPANFMPNGSAVPPRDPRREPGRGPDQPDSATSAQQAISTAHPAAVPPGATDGRGPSARLTASPRRWLSRIAWSVS